MHILFLVKEIDNEPHGILLLSAMLKQHGHQVSLVVATQEDPCQAALRLKPDILAYSVYTGTQRYYLELNRRIRAQMPALSVFGGPHPTFFPEMIEEEGVDGICIGEGEQAFAELADAMQAGKSYANIRNWWFKIDGQIVRNPLRPLLTGPELDALPFADRELLYAAYPPSRNNYIRPFITGRGCPYDCSFCFNRAYARMYREAGHPVKVRRRSVDSILQEIQEVAAHYRLDFIIFMDDTFILNPRWLREFAQRYPKAIGLPYWCQVRANLVTPEIAALLRRTGCVSVSFGIEAGNDRLRNDVLKRDMSKQQILQAAAILRHNYLAFSTNNMLGLPGGNLSTDLETLALNVRCRPAYANVFLFQPYPKTELGEAAYRQGFMQGSFDDLSGSVTQDTPIRFGSPLEHRAIENLQKLFALTVQFPFLLPLVRLLIYLPPNPAFWMTYKLWKGFAWKKHMFPTRMGLSDYWQALRQYMQIRSQ